MLACILLPCNTMNPKPTGGGLSLFVFTESEQHLGRVYLYVYIHIYHVTCTF